MNAAARQREYRARLRRCESAYWVDVGEDVFAALEYLRLLDPRDADDPTKVRAALSRYLTDCARRDYPFAAL